MTPAQEEKVREIALWLARKYSARSPWADFRDLEQTALLAQYQAAELYSDERGAFGSYMWTIGAIAVVRYLRTMHAPVSSRHRPARLDGLTSVEPDDRVQRQLWLDADYDRRDLARRVRERIREVAGAENVEFALGLLSHDWSVDEIAAYHGISHDVIRAALREIKTALLNDEQLWELWRQSCR